MKMYRKAQSEEPDVIIVIDDGLRNVSIRNSEGQYPINYYELNNGKWVKPETPLMGASSYEFINSRRDGFEGIQELSINEFEEWKRNNIGENI